jgi:hypothetical protein
MAYTVASLIFAALFAGCAHTLGLGLLATLGAGRIRSGPPPRLLAVPAGTGALALMLFVLASIGALRPMWIIAATVLSVAGAGYAVLKQERQGAVRSRPPPVGPWLGAAAVGVVVTVVLLAMSVPLEWDELAYHLPYARDYAEAGGLVVSEKLRFPLQSHNYQLLYATALLFAYEPAAHLLHALSGVLVAAGMFVFARHHFGQSAAILSVIMYFSFSGSLLDTAYVDLGATLFVFFAFYSFTLWQQSRNDGFLLLAAFLVAIAAGTKYQALAQLPGFALALMLAGRRDWLRPAIRAAAVFLLFGSWWYTRSWMVSGDPIHPLGGELFGYWLWDKEDLAAQVADIGRYRDHLPFELAPALLGFLLLRRRRDPAVRSLLIVALAGLAAWYLSSRYDRYLLPTYPFLAMLSAAVIVMAGRRLAEIAPLRSLALAARDRAPTVLRLTALGLCAAVLVPTVGGKWDEICFTHACMERVHAQRFASPAAARAVPDFSNLKLFQLGLENEIYLMGDDTAGDWFGPYRYRSVLALADDPEALREHLLESERDSLLINRERPPFAEFSRRFAPPPGTFEKLYEDHRVTLYRIAGD